MIGRLKDILRSEINSRLEDNEGFKKFFDDKDLDIEEILKGFKKKKDEDFDVEAEYESYQQRKRKEEREYSYTHTSKNKDQQYYEDLELPYGAPFDQVKKQYRKMMKVYHPDLYHNDPEKYKIAQEISRKINEAYVHFEKKFGK